MDPLARRELITRYQETRCDIRRDGEWHSIDAVPARPVFLVSAWNPGGTPAGAAENARHDDDLRRHLEQARLQPRRVRGRSRTGHEEGWMIPYERSLALALLARYGQVAGVIWNERGRTLLWADGLTSPLDGDQCAMPAVDAV
jgi:hypothetical protein